MYSCRIFVCLLILTTALPGQLRRTRPSSNDTQPALQPTATFKGVIKTVENGKILLELPDGNIMEFRTTRKSRYKVAGKDAKWKDLVSGQSAEIDGRYFLGAVDVVTVTVAAAKARPE